MMLVDLCLLMPMYNYSVFHNGFFQLTINFQIKYTIKLKKSLISYNIER